MKKVQISRSVYSDKTIASTIKIYQNHAIVTAEFECGYVVLTFSKCKYDEEQTIKEFENYMIGIENS